VRLLDDMGGNKLILATPLFAYRRTELATAGAALLL
jgi:hypothetical protein